MSTETADQNATNWSQNHMCQTCRGKGEYPGIDITCRTCNGTGIQPEPGPMEKIADALKNARVSPSLPYNPSGESYD